MERTMKKIYHLILVLVFGLFLANLCVFAQQGTSSASVSRSRALQQQNANPNTYRAIETFVAPDEVIVDEFFNYHKHELPLPKVGKSVALDTRWGNDKISQAVNEAVLQIGWTTVSVDERTDLKPLNLSLVIDRSGSMAAEDKMRRVKESLITMVDQLRPDDIVSIVVFETDARVLCPAVRVGNGYALKSAIGAITPGGSTNLYAGLLSGYREALKNYKRDATNRVILLTDGIANTGITDPKQIALESSEYNGQGIDLSTIGVGIELDRELLRTPSKQGRGLFHFVADAKDINKVFVDEVESLISPVARRPELEIEFDSNLQIEKIYGYEPKFNRTYIRIPIDDMNSGLTQIALIKFGLKNIRVSRREFPVKIRLSYDDIKTRRRITEEQNAVLRFSREKNFNTLADPTVKKNFTIAELAQSLQDMSETAKAGNHQRAEGFLNKSVSDAYRRYPNMEDKDIRFVLGIVEDYQSNLRRYNRGNGDYDGCGKC